MKQYACRCYSSTELAILICCYIFIILAMYVVLVDVALDLEEDVMVVELDVGILEDVVLVVGVLVELELAETTVLQLPSQQGK